MGAFHNYKSDQGSRFTVCFYAEVLPLHHLEYNSVVGQLDTKKVVEILSWAKIGTINRALTRLYAQVTMWVVCFNNGGGTILILATIIITNVAGKVW